MVRTKVVVPHVQAEVDRELVAWLKLTMHS